MSISVVRGHELVTHRLLMGDHNLAYQREAEEKKAKKDAPKDARATEQAKK